MRAQGSNGSGHETRRQNFLRENRSYAEENKGTEEPYLVK